MKTYIQTSILLFLLLLNNGCKKFLNEKTDQRLVVIKTLADLQSILENYNLINNRDAGSGEASADNYFVTDADYNSRSEPERNLYTWAKANQFAVSGNDWNLSYDNVYRANIVLDNIKAMERTTINAQQWDDIKGQALFLRAKSFFQVAQLFALAYDEGTAGTDLGIPLRLSPDFNETSVRSSVQQTYDRIIEDLKHAAELLPNTPIHVLRASKPAAYGLLARTYLAMRKYADCYTYADLALQVKSTIIAFNTLNTNATFPFAPEFSNQEIIYASKLQQPTLLSGNRNKIDVALYRSYHADDLRKKVFFSNNANEINTFKGAYTGSAISFSGIAINEILLMRAECQARLGNAAAALTDLNALMSKRWNPATFSPITATDANDALNKILTERRKELVMSNLRWMDIKRLNKEGANIILKRTVAGHEYTLVPNDLRYALAIPENVIALSGMAQNPR